VIARVRPHSTDSSTPPKYRCIAAFHHQWCYGLLPLDATHRFVTQVKQKNNVEIIRSEIAAIQGKFGRWKEEPAPPAIPCPFTTFLLATNWSVNLEESDVPYASGVSFNNDVLPAYMGSGEGDNNDGISVIDVTDPTEPSYCFVSVSGLEAGESPAVPERIPLSAEQYARAYYPPPATAKSNQTVEEATEHRGNLAVEEDVQATIAMLKDIKLVNLAMLAEAWPAEYDPNGKVEKVADIITEPVTSGVPSLVDLTMPPAVAHAVQAGETAGIEAMVWMPDKASAIKAALRQLSPFPNAGLELLRKVVEKEIERPHAELDLTGFTLSCAQLENLISPMREIDAVNLSHIPITIDGVRIVLTKFPQLKRLNLLDCPSISTDSIYSLLHTEPHLFNQLEGLIHPSLLGELKDATDCCPYHNAFSYIGVYHHYLKACSLPFFTPSRVVQALIDTLQPLCEQYNSYSFLQTSFAMQAAFSSVRAPGQQWSKRNTVVIPQLSLRALKGEGWTFAIMMDPYDGGGCFAFLRFKLQPSIVNDKEQPDAEGKEYSAASGLNKTDALGWEIHDLASFVDQVVLDGKPSPPDKSVNKLQKILAALQTTQSMQLMCEADVSKFIDGIKMSVRRLY